MTLFCLRLQINKITCSRVTHTLLFIYLTEDRLLLKRKTRVFSEVKKLENRSSSLIIIVCRRLLLYGTGKKLTGGQKDDDEVRQETVYYFSLILKG